MPLAADQLRIQPEKLRKSLKKLPSDSSVGRVHQLRTRSRRLEAMFRALTLDSQKNERKLLQAIKPIRKKAGKVRDMDVLTQYAAIPKIRGEEECSVRLLEHLGGERQKKARKLQKASGTRAAGILQGLKKASTFLDKSARKDPALVNRWSAEATALALGLEAELRDWPPLTRKNLHPFRLKIKELLYVLQLAENPDNDFADALDEVKDDIGEWHDWQELLAIGKEVLPHRRCRLLSEIQSTAQKKFELALSAANRLRQQRLGPKSARGRRLVRIAPKAQPAFISAATLAA